MLVLLTNLKKDDTNKEYDKFYLLPKSLLRQYDKIKFYSRLISKKRNKNQYYIHSKSYKEAITKLNNAYTRAYNIQEANLNNIVKYFFDNYNRIVIEDLDVNSMKMNKRLCKSLHRNAFGRFKRKMVNKAEEYNVEFILADRYSQALKLVQSVVILRLVMKNYSYGEISMAMTTILMFVIIVEQFKIELKMPS